jgi:cell division septation protein DedD
VAIVIGIGLIAALPLGWNAMREYQFQNQAQAFTRWIEDRETQEGTSSVGDYTVGVDPEVAMASYINEALPQNESSILVDENFSYGPMILSGRPTLFADRADEGEGEWEETIDNPYGRVDYMLITISRGGDQLRKRYPEAISGGELGMTPIFRTERYVLIEVSQTKPPAEAVARPGEVVPSPTPTPFTPQKPPDPSNPDATTTIPGTAPEPTVTPTPAPAPTTGSGPTGGATAPQIEGE